MTFVWVSLGKIACKAGRITNSAPDQRQRYLPDKLCTTVSGNKIPALTSISPS